MAAAELTDADLCLALPSDTELALQILWKDCPPGALVANGLQAALRSQVYGIVNDRTAVLNFFLGTAPGPLRSSWILEISLPREIRIKV